MTNKPKSFYRITKNLIKTLELTKDDLDKIKLHIKTRGILDMSYHLCSSGDLWSCGMRCDYSLDYDCHYHQQKDHRITKTLLKSWVINEQICNTGLQEALKRLNHVY